MTPVQDFIEQRGRDWGDRKYRSPVNVASSRLVALSPEGAQSLSCERRLISGCHLAVTYFSRNYCLHDPISNADLFVVLK